MGAPPESNSTFSKTFPSLKIIAVEQTLSQAVVNFRDLVLEFEQLHLENVNYKEMFHKQKEEFESQKCSSCEELRKTITTKEQILNTIVLMLNKLTHTKDFNLIDVILKQIYGETNILTPPRSVSPHKDQIDIKVPNENNNENEFKELVSPKKEVKDTTVSNDESVSEIESTPTGRKSPIFQTRKTKPNTNALSLKDKKKCPETWPTPENKAIKLTYPTPTRSKSGGRLRQGRLNLVKLKNTNVVDLTCSPEYSAARSNSETNIQCIVKKEVIDNDETILPSPTSGPFRFQPVFKTISKDSPTKFKKPSVISKLKIEAETNDRNIENKLLINENGKETQNSINILNQFPNRFLSPIKKEKTKDESHCGDESISLLQHVKKNEPKNFKQPNSPIKRPLTENMNIINIQNHENESSMSILQKDPAIKADNVNDDLMKRAKVNLAPVYKEPTVRKKAEKRALPGWSCDQCRIFYDELYKNDPVMLAQKMNECSKHRGRTNPVRPKTPDGFWNPRWDVPEDTEEFNRRNNAV